MGLDNLSWWQAALLVLLGGAMLRGLFDHRRELNRISGDLRDLRETLQGLRAELALQALPPAEREARIAERQAAQPPSDDDVYRDLLRDGKKIEAIQRYRERQDVGLREAKEAIERLEERGG